LQLLLVWTATAKKCTRQFSSYFEHVSCYL
jgi:hypothetical protein